MGLAIIFDVDVGAFKGKSATHVPASKTT